MGVLAYLWELLGSMLALIWKAFWTPKIINMCVCVLFFEHVLHLVLNAFCCDSGAHFEAFLVPERCSIGERPPFEKPMFS